MKEENKIQEVIDMLEKPIVEYVQGLMAKIGIKTTKEGAENIVSNVGVSILKRKKILTYPPSL